MRIATDSPSDGAGFHFWLYHDTKQQIDVDLLRKLTHYVLLILLIVGFRDYRSLRSIGLMIAKCGL